MKWFRLNLKTLIMLAVLAGLLAAFFTNLPESSSSEFTPLEFSPDGKSLLTIEQRRFQFESRIDLVGGNVWQLETRKRVDLKTNEDSSEVVDWSMMIPAFADSNKVVVSYQESVGGQSNLLDGNSENLISYRWHPYLKWELDKSNEATPLDPGEETEFIYLRVSTTAYLYWKSFSPARHNSFGLVDLSSGDPTLLLKQIDPDTLHLLRKRSGLVWRLSKTEDFNSSDRSKFSLQQDGKRKISTLSFPLDADVIPAENFECFVFRYLNEAWLVDSNFQLVKEFEIDHGLVPVISRNGNRVALMDPDGAIKVIDSQSGQIVREMELPASDLNPILLFSNDGDRIAIAYEDQLDVWDIDSGEKIFELDQSNKVYSVFVIAFGLLAWSAVFGSWIMPVKKPIGMWRVPFKMGFAVIGCFSVPYLVGISILGHFDSLILSATVSLLGFLVWIVLHCWTRPRHHEQSNLSPRRWLVMLFTIGSAAIAFFFGYLCVHDFDYLLMHDALPLARNALNHYWLTSGIATGMLLMVWASRLRLQKAADDSESAEES